MPDSWMKGLTLSLTAGFTITTFYISDFRQWLTLGNFLKSKWRKHDWTQWDPFLFTFLPFDATKEIPHCSQWVVFLQTPVVLHVLLKIQSILLHLWLIMYFDFMQDFLISCKDSCNLEPTCFPVTPCASLAPWSNPLAVPALAGWFLPLSLCSVLPHYPWPPYSCSFGCFVEVSAFQRCFFAS